MNKFKIFLANRLGLTADSDADLLRALRIRSQAHEQLQQDRDTLAHEYRLLSTKYNWQSSTLQEVRKHILIKK